MLALFFPSFFWLGFCSLPSLAVTSPFPPSYCVQYQYSVQTHAAATRPSHLPPPPPLVVLLPPSRVRDAASSATGKAQTRQLGTGGVVSSRIGRPARSCMPACLTVSARRLSNAMNGRDALPSHQGPASSNMLQPGRPPSLAFFLLFSLSSAVLCLEGVARTEGGRGKTKGPGDGGAAGTTEQAISSSPFSNVRDRGVEEEPRGLLQEGVMNGER
ncbi:uncharacterized protein Triagg1_904 [Trichoderma aggressivum f. europaeum]|uniref:Transmembrane protein n=1 Tax=Trichoderma aggressivum f. europaeum TaxID=173218 RepID=A0AAE1M6U2_9HYPO|nr:hypothetical protein Triagg1_904 [Trichoderma aggressivum f. europaeum]